LDESGSLDNKTYADIVGWEIRREIMTELEGVGITPLTAHHERAPSQHEITFRHDDAVRSCDNLVLAKLVIESVATRYGLTAIFDPKPFDGVNGSGLHTNISLWENGKNIFAGVADLSDTAKHFMAGVLTHAQALSFITNPTEGSYRRLVMGYEAPSTITWGNYDRTSMIRIPLSCGNSTRLEIRTPDNTMNPYVGVAAIVRAGMDGISKKLPPPPIDDAVLPVSLSEARQEFHKSELFSDLLHNIAL